MATSTLPIEKARNKIPFTISLAFAVVLCLVGSFVMVGMLPSPVTNNIVDNANAPHALRMTKVAYYRNKSVDRSSELLPYSSSKNDKQSTATNEPTLADASAHHNNDVEQPQQHKQQQQSNQSSNMIIENTQLTANTSLSENPRLIHILETRFMQNQPNLIELAKARLHLLQTICLPSVLHQTAWGDFYWIIRTDPTLHTTIRSQLISILEESGAFIHTDEYGTEHAVTYVIGSNDNYIVPNSTTLSSSVRPFDIQAMLSTTLSNNHTLFAGKVSDMQNLLDEISLPRFSNDIVLWTRLDADDGLNIRYMEYIQEQAIRYFVPRLFGMDIVTMISENYVKERMEQLLRMRIRIQRQQQKKRRQRRRQQQLQKQQQQQQQQQQQPNQSSLENNEKDDKEDGDDDDIISDDQEGINMTQSQLIPNTYIPPQWTYWCAGKNIDWFLTDPIHDPLHSNGTVYPVIHANVCVTPGVTVAIHGSFNPMHVPRLDHDKIISYLRPRGGRICHRSGLSVFNTSSLDGSSTLDREERIDEDDGSCFHMVNVGISAVRSRTPTSAGMLGIMPDATQKEIVLANPNLPDLMWRSMKNEFRILNRNLLRTNAYFAEHVYDIAEENARGQCTTGHSCKSSSKDLLQQYADLASERGGGYDVVNGLPIIAENENDNGR